MLARAIAYSGRMPIEAALIAVCFGVAFVFLVAGWVLGRRVDALSDEARRDPVTKVGNRRHWEECLLHEVDSASRAHMPLSLLMIDVDNLKTLNDAGGHVAGDLALSLVGKVLNETCRSRDVAARFGGDEFAVLLPRTRSSEARVLAERIRAAIIELRTQQTSPVDRLLTVSIGISELDLIDEPNPHLLVDSADRALYTAKQAGRNRVEVYDRGPMHSTVIVLADHRRNRKRRTTRSG
jgi:diguanylate cyclase (GGDEF)-like protein